MKVFPSFLVSFFVMILVRGPCVSFSSKPSNTDGTWVDTGNKTAYYIERHLETTWYDAKRMCGSMVHSGQRGRLAAFETKKEMLFLQSHIKDSLEYFWLGPHLLSDGAFVWADINRGYGASGHLFLVECVGINAFNMTWTFHNCNSERPFICAFDTETEWIDVGTKNVYYIERHWETTWMEARKICASMERSGQRGRLANFETKGELRDLLKYLRETSGNVWIGLHSDFNGSFMWTDGSSPAFTAWSRGEPSNVFSEDCVEVNADTWNWNDLSCDEKRLYICAFDKASTSGGRVAGIDLNLVISLLVLSTLVV